MARHLLLFTAILALCQNFNAHGNRITLDVWCELEPMVFESDEYPISPETAARRMLEEARVLISAMIFGYKFIYTPSDKSRRVADLFELTPIAEIKWGDPNLKIIFTEKRGNRMYCKVAYSMVGYQMDRRQSWGSNTLPTATGRGAQSILKGIEAKLDAFKESIKEAIRDYARKHVFNKPREISGELILWQQPATIITAGQYSTESKIKLFIRKLIPYRLY